MKNESVIFLNLDKNMLNYDVQNRILEKVEENKGKEKKKNVFLLEECLNCIKKEDFFVMQEDICKLNIEISRLELKHKNNLEKFQE